MSRNPYSGTTPGSPQTIRHVYRREPRSDRGFLPPFPVTAKRGIDRAHELLNLIVAFAVIIYIFRGVKVTLGTLGSRSIPAVRRAAQGADFPRGCAESARRHSRLWNLARRAGNCAAMRQRHRQLPQPAMPDQMPRDL